MKELKTVGIWIRVSTEDQAKGDSPEHHLARAKMYAAVKEWEVAEVYHLEGVSGKKVMEHPEAQRMLKDIERGHISGLIFSKLARLARNTKELLEFSDFFKEHNADLISLQESIDTSSPAGRLFYTLIAAMAQWEREEISERVAASVPIRAKLGKSTGGQAPFGYRWVDNQLELDPEEAPIRKLMMELYLTHKRKNKVARILNERGYRTRRGGKFSETSVNRLLRDPIAKGLRRANYTKSLGKGKQWVSKPQEEWVFVPAPAIVSEEVWEEANKILDQFSFTRKKKPRSVSHLFSGHIYCHCGGKMYVPYKMKKYVCHKCRNKMVIIDMEEIFHEQLQEYILSDDILQKRLLSYSSEIKAKELELQNATKQAKDIKARMDSMLDLVHKGELPQVGFKQHYQPLFDQLQQLEEWMPQLEGQIAAMKDQYQSRDYILNEAKAFYQRWPSMSFDEKRSIVETLVESIVIGEEDDITINLNYLPNAANSPELVANAPRNPMDSQKKPAKN